MDMEKIGQAGRLDSNSIDMRRKRRKAEVALRGNEEKYRILIQTLPYIVYEVDAGGRFIFVSDGVKQLGYAHLNQGASKA